MSLSRALTGESWHLEDFDVDAYLARIGVERAEPTVEFLNRMHEAHVRSIPFGNVEVLLGQHPGVAPATVQRQLVERHRGGYCFEHGQLFAAAATGLGFPVRRRLGRAGSQHNARTHMTVLVEAEGEWFLADPGFGFSIRRPIQLRHGASRGQGGRVFTLALQHGDDTDRWVLSRDGDPLHFVEPLSVQPVDVHTGHKITSLGLANDRFTRNLIVTRHTPEGHVTVTQSTRTVRPDNAPTEHEQITPAQAVDAVRELGIVLVGDEPETLRRVLAELPSLTP